MQNQLNAVTLSALPADFKCHASAPTTTKTSIVIQKSESFHAENSFFTPTSTYNNNNNNIQVVGSDLPPKLKRTTSEIGKSILGGCGAVASSGSKIRPSHCRPIVKQKSDYSLSRNLYENYEIYDSEVPLLPTTDIKCKEINVKIKDEKNNTLVYTTKNNCSGAASASIVKKRQSVPSANGLKVVETPPNNKYTSHWRHSWYAPVYGVLEEESETNIKVGNHVWCNFFIA